MNLHGWALSHKLIREANHKIEWKIVTILQNCDNNVLKWLKPSLGNFGVWTQTLELQFLVHSSATQLVSFSSHVCRRRVYIKSTLKPCPLWTFHIASTQSDGDGVHGWRSGAVFVPTFSLAGPVHLYSAEPVESLSDKAGKEWEKDGFGGGSSNTTTMMKVSPPLAAPDLSYAHNSCLKYPWSTQQWLVGSDSDQNGKSYVLLNSWWNCN